MKKLLLQIITLVLAVSCQVTELTPVRDMTDDCLYGTMESMNATKTSMDENNNILWSEGDQLVAFMKTSLGRKYQIKEEYVGSTTGGFSRVTEESSGDDLESGNELSHNVVLYPYASTSCMKNDVNETSNSYKVNLNLPEIQTYAVGSFGNGSFPMIAVSSSNELLFKNICGGIKLQFKGEDKIKSIKLESIGGEKISGKATVIGYADETVPTTIMAEKAVSSVTLDCGDGVQLSDEPTTFIISVPPVVFESGMKITVTDTDGISRELTNTSKNTIKRSTLLTFPVITYTQTGVFELAEGTLTSYEVKAEGGTIEIPVVTNQDYQVVIPENAAEWITVVATRALREETIILNVTENATPEARSAEVHIATAENITLQTITISQEAGIDFANAIDLSMSGSANSYIVSETGVYKFPAVKGNSEESVGAVASVEVLWESFGTEVTPSVGDLVVRASCVNDYIAFSTPENFKEGNAVIAAKNSKGVILWSWHIWLTDKPEDQTYYSGDIMMDRNIGATSATPGDIGALGLLYEWGRKDPFLGSSNIHTHIEAKSTITWPSPESYDGYNPINYAIENPTTFITYCNADEDNFDWEWSTPGSTNHRRWMSTKTIYDPCPAGYHVPDGGKNGVWAKAFGSSSKFTDSSCYNNTNEGMNFTGKLGTSSIIWYPAAGYRYYTNGTLLVGGYGCYWSVTPYDDASYTLSFGNSGRIDPVDYAHHAYGLPVRCMKNPVPEDSSQASYSVQLKPSTYGWVKSSTVPNPDTSLYDGVYESTNQGQNDTQSLMYIDINGYDEFTIYVRSYAESNYDYVQVSNLDTDISSVKMTTKGNQQSGTSLSSYTEVTFTNIGGGQHRIMVVYKKDYSQHSNDDKGYVLIPKNQGSNTPEVPSGPQDGDYIDEYGINHGQGVEIDGVVWAPVNCGYHATDYKYGKLYQWGRKYGQGYNGPIYDINGNQSGTYTDASVPSIVTKAVSLSVGQSYSNSNKFYTYTSSYYYFDWVTPQNNTLWNSGTDTSPIKTEYDPCPEGWRVPTYAELNNLKANYSSWTTNAGQNGLWFSGLTSYSESVSRVFLPTAGSRGNSEGSADERGIRGLYHSSSPSGSRACGFDIYYGAVNMYDGSMRVNGHSVRCVQE